MLIDFQQKILDLDGRAYKEGEFDITLASIVEVAITTPTEDSIKLPSDQKVHRAMLAQDIHRNGKVDVRVEDVAMIKDAISLMGYNFLIIAECFAILDPKVEAVSKEK